MNELPQFPGGGDARSLPGHANRTGIPDRTELIKRTRQRLGTYVDVAETPQSKPAASGEEQPAPKKFRKGKVLLGIGGLLAVVVALNAVSSGEEPSKSTGGNDILGTAPKRPGTTAAAPQTTASAETTRKQSSTEFSCNMTSVATGVDKTGQPVRTAEGLPSSAVATLSIENAKSPNDIAIRVGVIVKNALDKSVQVSAERNTANDTYSIANPKADTVYALYAAEGSSSEICGGFRIANGNPQMVSEATLPPTLPQ